MKWNDAFHVEVARYVSQSDNTVGLTLSHSVMIVYCHIVYQTTSDRRGERGTVIRIHFVSSVHFHLVHKYLVNADTKFSMELDIFSFFAIL